MSARRGKRSEEDRRRRHEKMLATLERKYSRWERRMQERVKQLDPRRRRS